MPLLPIPHQKPPVSPLVDITAQAISLATETARKNRILMSGFQKIQVYLETASIFDRTDINNIIAETMTQIS